VTTNDPADLQRRLADAERRLRRVADAIGSPAEAAGGLADATPEDGAPGDLAARQQEALLARVGRLAAALETLPPGAPGELVAMRTILGDLAVVVASFRRRAAAVAGSLDTTARELDEARSAAERWDQESEDR